MLKFVAFALFLAVVSVSGEGCCAPKQWESFVGIENTTAVDGMIKVTQTYAMESYDFDRKKIAMVFPTEGFRMVQDYDKKKLYIIAGTYCSAIPWPYPMINCIPENATLLFSYEMGGSGGLMVNQYNLDAFLHDFKGSMQFTDKCIPVSQQQYFDSYVTMFGFTNVTTGIKDPSVFDVPSPPCPMATDIDNVLKPLLFEPAQP